MSSATRFRGTMGRIPGLRGAHHWLQSVVRTRATGITESSPRPSGNYAELLFAHEGRQLHKWLHYCAIYDDLVGPFAHGFPASGGQRRPVRLLEIGVLHGGSLEVWREYLGAGAVICGIDIDPRCAEASRADLMVRIGSQSDEEFLHSVVAEMGGIDIVVDDGSHIAALQRKSFDVLFPLLSPGGVYIVEDTHTSYFWSYGGGFRRHGSIVETAKRMVDGLHKWHFRTPIGPRGHLASRDVYSIRFYDSVVAFQKAPRGQPQVGEFGSQTLR